MANAIDRFVFRFLLTLAKDFGSFARVRASHLNYGCLT